MTLPPDFLKARRIALGREGFVGLITELRVRKEKFSLKELSNEMRTPLTVVAEKKKKMKMKLKEAGKQPAQAVDLKSFKIAGVAGFAAQFGAPTPLQPPDAEQRPEPEQPRPEKLTFAMPPRPEPKPEPKPETQELRLDDDDAPANDDANFAAEQRPPPDATQFASGFDEFKSSAFESTSGFGSFQQDAFRSFPGDFAGFGGAKESTANSNALVQSQFAFGFESEPALTPAEKPGETASELKAQGFDAWGFGADPKLTASTGGGFAETGGAFSSAFDSTDWGSSAFGAQKPG